MARRKKSKKVRGFEANARRIASRQGVSMSRARAILAAGARKASPAARRKNPRLKRVSGVPGHRSTRRRSSRRRSY